MTFRLHNRVILVHFTEIQGNEARLRRCGTLEQYKWCALAPPKPLRPWARRDSISLILKLLLSAICCRKMAKMALFERLVSIEASCNTKGGARGSLNGMRLALSIIPDAR